MPGDFFDSSALGKPYHAEVGIARVKALFQDPQSLQSISRMSVVELQSILAGKVRTRAITAAGLELLRTRFLQDVAQREFLIIRMTDVHYRGSEHRCLQAATPKDCVGDQPLRLIARVR